MVLIPQTQAHDLYPLEIALMMLVGMKETMNDVYQGFTHLILLERELLEG